MKYLKTIDIWAMGDAVRSGCAAGVAERRKLRENTPVANNNGGA
jgi:hypothetical protein